MSELTAGQKTLLDEIEPLRGARILEKLAGGPASDSWLLMVGDDKFVARLDKPLAGLLGLDRAAEPEVLQIVSAAGIGPQIIWANADKGVLVTSYIPGNAWSREDIHDPTRLVALATCLRQLHALPPGGPVFAPGKVAMGYARQAATHKATRIAQQTSKLADKLLSGTRRPALCHNDLVHSNIIGGDSTVELNGAVFPVEAGNVIRGNRGDGVRVDGVGSVFNSITNNIISGHNNAGALGIQAINGGNSELPPPVINSYDGTTVEGTVNASIPNGSIVQIFTDPGDEGLHFMAEAIVADGSFSTVAGPWLYTNVCATVTHAVNHNTSEFSCLQTDPPLGLYGLDIRRSTNPVEVFDIQAGRSSTVVSIKLSVGEGDVFVDALSFESLGSADESVAITDISLHLDQDEDGRLSNGDSLLVNGVLVGSDNGTADFTDLGLVLAANSVEHWLLVVTLADAATLGTTIEFRLADNTRVDSAGLLPVTPILETGAYPVNSDQATIVQKLPSGEDIMQAILTGNGYFPAMDLNNDGVVDVADAVMAEQMN